MTETIRGRAVLVAGIETGIEEVDPGVASRWLDANLDNRRPVRHKIEQYKRDIAAGRWSLTGEAIKFDRDGVLLDGQNRLIAVVETGRSIVTLVVRGLDGTARRHMDTGAARSAGQALTMLGHRYGGDLAAVAQVAILLAEGRPLASGRRSHEEILRFVEENPDIEPVVQEYGRSLPMLPAAANYVAWVLTGIDSDLAAEFLAELRSGANLPEVSPVLAARGRLGRLQADTKLSRGIRVESQIATAFRAWNAWRNGEPLTKIVLGLKQGGRPVIPEPIGLK